MLDKAKILEFVLTVPSWKNNFTEDKKNTLNELCLIFTQEMNRETLYEPVKKYKAFENFDEFVESMLNNYCEKYTKKSRTLIRPYVGIIIKNYLEDVKRNSKNYSET